MGRGAFPLPVPSLLALGADVAEAASVPAAGTVVEVTAGVGEGLGSELGVRCGAIGRGRAAKIILLFILAQG